MTRASFMSMGLTQPDFEPNYEEARNSGGPPVPFIKSLKTIFSLTRVSGPLSRKKGLSRYENEREEGGLSALQPKKSSN